MRRMTRIVVPLAVLVLASACGLTGAGSSPGERGAGPFTVVWGKESDPTGINPLKAGDVHAYEIFSLVYEPLTQPNADLGVGPGLAESWEQTSATSWRFRLRQGVRFSNGRPLTSEDVTGTWKAHEKTNVLKSIFPDIEAMTAVDERSFDVKLSATVPDLPHRLESFWVLPGRDWVAGTFNPDRELLGTGPYVAGKHTPGVSWTFDANPHYWKKGLPRPKRVEVKFIADDASRLAAVRTGEVDFAITANPDVRRILSTDPNIKVTVQNTPDLYYLQLNPLWKESKLLDKRVRQAVALAVDRRQMIGSALGGLGETTAITPRGLPDTCDPDGVLGSTGRDVAKAKALLKEAGVSGLRFRLTVVPAFGAVRAPQMAQVIQQNLKDIGVNVEVAVLDSGAWIEESFTNGTFDATLNWLTGGGTVTKLLAYLDPGKSPYFAKGISHDAQTLGLIRDALTEPMGPGRAGAMAKACDRLNDLAYFVPLVTKPTVIVHRSDRISPVYIPTEPNQMTFRRLAEFTPAP